MSQYLLVEMSIEDDGSEFETPTEAIRKRIPTIIYLGEFEQIEDAVAAKTAAERNNPGMAYAFHILAVLE